MGKGKFFILMRMVGFDYYLEIYYNVKPSSSVKWGNNVFMYCVIQVRSKLFSNNLVMLNDGVCCVLGSIGISCSLMMWILLELIKHY